MRRAGSWIQEPWVRRNDTTVLTTPANRVGVGVDPAAEVKLDVEGTQSPAAEAVHATIARTGAMGAGEFVVGYVYEPGGNAGDNANSFVTALWAQSPTGPASKQVLFVEGNQAGGSFWTQVILSNDNDIVISNVRETIGAPNDIVLEVATVVGGTPGTIRLDGAMDVALPDNTANVLLIHEGANEYIAVDTTNGTERLNIGETSVSASLVRVRANVHNASTTAFQIVDNSRSFFLVDTSSPLVRVGGTSRVDIGSVGVSGSQTNIVVPDNVAGALLVMDPSSVGYIVVNTSNGNELILLGNNSTNPVIRAESLFEINDAWRISSTISPAALSNGGTTNNYNPAGLSTASTVRQDALGPHTLTGLVPPDDTGRTLQFFNVSGSTLTFTHDDAGSTDVNRFLLPGAANFALPTMGGLRLWYDLTTNRWRTTIGGA